MPGSANASPLSSLAVDEALALKRIVSLHMIGLSICSHDSDSLRTQHSFPPVDRTASMFCGGVPTDMLAVGMVKF